jgi:hypothetical protein
MPRITLVRYTAKPERAQQNEALSRSVFKELERVRPKGVAYALFRQGDDFVHLFVNLRGEESAPVTELASFKAFEAEAKERFTAAPEVLRLEPALVASYGFEAVLEPA